MIAIKRCGRKKGAELKRHRRVHMTSPRGTRDPQDPRGPRGPRAPTSRDQRDPRDPRRGPPKTPIAINRQPHKQPPGSTLQQKPSCFMPTRSPPGRIGLGRRKRRRNSGRDKPRRQRSPRGPKGPRGTRDHRDPTSAPTFLKAVKHALKCTCRTPEIRDPKGPIGPRAPLP